MVLQLFSSTQMRCLIGMPTFVVVSFFVCGYALEMSDVGVSRDLGDLLIWECLPSIAGGCFGISSSSCGTEFYLLTQRC